MPHILVHLPKGAFPGIAREALVRRITDISAEVEQMPSAPAKRALCWVVVHDVEPGGWACGGVDPGAQLLPCLVMAHLPAGVLDDVARARYVRGMHEAFEQSVPAEDKRRLATSVVLQEVADGTWGANGMLWKLPDFARASGYAHLQHLVEP